jgi:hypothetical protein
MNIYYSLFFKTLILSARERLTDKFKEIYPKVESKTKRGLGMWVSGKALA